jgi:hypothetical protein
MNLITHGIVDCKGFKIVRSWLWFHRKGKKGNSELQNRGDRKWGFIICLPSVSMVPRYKFKMDKLYGVIGTIQTDLIREACLGIPLKEASDIPSALNQFALSCGLSIIEKAQIELGDTIIISGVNPLALSVLVAAKAQGASIFCLFSPFEAEFPYQRSIEKLADGIIEFKYNSSFNDKFNEFVASSLGKTVFIDTIGEPGLVYSMAIRLEKFETMVFCRQEADTSVMLNLRNVHHLKSAKFVYWARPENLEEALVWRKHSQRAARLLNYKRIINFSTDLSDY